MQNNDITNLLAQYETTKNINIDTILTQLDDTGTQPYDTGARVPIFIAKEQKTHNIRILPNLYDPTQFWQIAFLYSFQPPTLNKGFSPKTFKKPDIFDEWLRATIPYSKVETPLNKAFRSCFSQRRVLIWVLIRSTHENIDNNKLYIWNMPFKQGGWETVVAPVVKQWVTISPSPWDLKDGREATFTVVGTDRDRKIAAFNWIGNPCPICPAQKWNMFIKTLQDEYKPFEQTYNVLTDDDLKAYIDYYEPIAEAFILNPELAITFTTNNINGAKDPRARIMAINYLKQQKIQVPANAPIKQQLPPPPIQLTPSMPIPPFQPGIHTPELNNTPQPGIPQLPTFQLPPPPIQNQ